MSVIHLVFSETTIHLVFDGISDVLLLSVLSERIDLQSLWSRGGKQNGLVVSLEVYGRSEAESLELAACPLGR